MDQRESDSMRLGRPRVVAGVVDQGVSSLTNFLTLFIAARLLPAAQFGSIVIVMGVAVVARTAQRALSGDTLLAYASGRGPEDRGRLERDCISAAAVAGVVAAIIVAGIGALPFELTHGILWLAPWLPVVLVQDVCRYVFYCEQRPEHALWVDAAWLLVQVCVLAVIVIFHVDMFFIFVGAWGMGSLAGAVTGLSLLRTNLLTGHPVGWVRETRHLSGWFGGQATLAQVHTQVVVFVVGGILGSVALAGLRAMQLLLVLPVQALLLAAQSLLVPYLARLYANKDQTRIRRQTSWLAAGFTVGAVAVSTLVIIVGNSLVELVFGASYARFANLLIPVAAAAVFSAARAPYTAACRALQNARGTFVIQAAQTIVTVPLALLGAVLWDAVGAAWGIAAGSAVLFVSALLVYRQTVATVLPARDAEHSGLL